MTKGKRIAVMVGALVAIAVLAVAMIYLNKNPELGTTPEQEEDSSAFGETIYILGSAEDRTPSKEITVSNQHGSYTAHRVMKDDTEHFEIEGLEPYALVNVKQIFDYGTTLTAREVVEETISDKATFGLDKPTITVDVTYEDGSQRALYFGSEAPGGAGHYVMAEGDDTLYLSTQTSAEYFAQDKLAFLNTELTGGNPESTLFHTVSIGGTAHEKPIEIEILDEDEMVSTSGYVLTSHRILGPFEGGLDSTRGYEKLATIFGITADQVVAVVDKDTNLASFGLEEPYAIISVAGEIMPQMEHLDPEPIEFTLSISQPDEEGNCFVIRKGTDLIYKVPASVFPWLELEAFDMVSKMVILPFINDLSGVEIKTPDKTTLFTIEVETVMGKNDQEKEEISIFVDGEQINEENFKKYYQTLIATSYDSEYQEAEEFERDSSKELLTISYNYSDGGSDVLHFYEAGARRILVSLNDNPPHFVQSNQLDRIIEDREKVLAGETVVPVI